MVRIGSPRKIAKAIISRHQNHRQDDQVIANLQHRALKVADGLRPLHQLRRLAEVGVRTRGIDQCADFALTNDRTGKHCLAGFARGGQRLPRQRGLIHFDRVAFQQARIRRHDVAHTHADDVARHQFARRRGDPLPITFHPGLDRQRGLQGSDGVARLVFFPKSDHGVGQKQNEDDAKVRPMPSYRRQNHRRFDHPRDRTPKIAEEFQELIGLLFFNLVRPILGQPFLRLGLRETIRRRSQFFLHLRQRQGFQIVLRVGFRSRLRFGSLRLGGIGFHGGYSFCLCAGDRFRCSAPGHRHRARLRASLPRAWDAGTLCASVPLPWSRDSSPPRNPGSAR